MRACSWRVLTLAAGATVTLCLVLPNLDNGDSVVGRALWMQGGQTLPISLRPGSSSRLDAEPSFKTSRNTATSPSPRGDSVAAASTTTVHQSELQEMETATSSKAPDSTSRGGAEDARAHLATLGPIGSGTPVFLHFGRSRNDHKAFWAFQPIILTLEEALQSVGMQTHRRFMEDNCPLLEEVRQILAKNITPVVMSVSPGKTRDLKGEAACLYKTVWGKFSKLPILRICYQSESHSLWFRMTAWLCKTWRVQEIWDFTMSTAFLGRKGPAVHRYMPPGCAASLDFGVQLNARERNESAVGFIGSWDHRPKDVQANYAGQFPGMLANTEKVTEPSLVRSFLERYPIQLNPHAFYNKGGLALETFRMAMLLTNKACVVSEPVNAQDTKVWNDVIMLVERNDTRAAYNDIRKSNDGVYQCQMRMHKEYCNRFGPSALLRNSGFTQLLQS